LIVEHKCTRRKVALGLWSSAASIMTRSLTPDNQRERAHAVPAGPAPTIRTVVLDGKVMVLEGFEQCVVAMDKSVRV